jgi:hypothetical protein
VKLHCTGVLQVVGVDVSKRWFRSLSGFIGEICAQYISLEDAMFYFAALESETWFSISRLIYKLSVLFFFYLVCEAIGTAATPGLLCQPRVIVKMIVEKQMECTLAGVTEVLGENLPSATFVHHIIPHDQTRV